MTEKLARAKGRYVGLQAYLKNVTSELNGYVSSEGNEQSKLLGFKTTLTQLITQYGTVHEEILSVVKPEEIEAEVINHMKSLEPAYEVLAQAELKLEQFKHTQYINTASLPSGLSLGSVGSHSSSSPQAHCKLPKIGLPHFTGNPLDWQGFWDQFRVSIHDNVNVNDIDKFNYLKGCLKGEAQATISGLTLSSENYTEAIDLLKDRFGNEQVLISAHMESLLKIDKIRSVTNIKGLRMLYTHVENCIRNLKALKLDTAGYGSLLIPILKDRLPDEINMIISRQFCGVVWSLDKVMEYFGNELKAQENCNLDKVTSDFSRKREPYAASGLFTHTRNKKGSCLYCGGDHFSSRCNKVTNCQARKAILRRHGRCFICLDNGHIAKNCTSQYVCKRCNRGKHHISICEADPAGKHTEHDKGEGGNNTTDKDSNSFTGHTGCENKGILLQTALADICSADTTEVKHHTRILFDSGSQRSYITKKARDTLRLKTLRTEKVIIKTFGQGNDSEVQELDVVQINIKDKFENKFTLIEALCVPTICSPLTSQPIASVKNIVEFKNLEFADSNDSLSPLRVGILVGIDFYHAFMTGRIIRSKDGPVASGTRLGWVISGRLGSSSPDLHCFETHLLRTTAEVEHSTDILRDHLDKFWATESIGAESDQVANDFQNNIVHDGTRYVTKLPFKPDHEPLPDNFKVSEIRLRSLKGRLKSKGILNAYDDIFKEYEKNGIIDRVPSCEVVAEVGKVHYLPHRPVIRADKTTTKIRAVFDASCKVNGPSLNECLYSGPNLITKIFDILIRFRLNKIAVMADIKQAFLNVAITPEHRDYLRFLWYDLGSEETIVYKFSRVVFGLTSSPFLLNATIKHHLNRYIENEQAVLERLKNDLYVDDLVSGSNSLEEGKKLYDRSKAIMLEAGFDLRKWETNDQELREYLTSQEGSKIDTSPRADDTTYSKTTCNSAVEETKNSMVLGLEWDANTDEFVFRFEDLLSRCSAMEQTKRNLLSVSASIYDPLGLIAPITARIKTIFQILCKDKLNWDDIIPSNIALVWNKFLDELKRLREIRQQRCVFSSHFQSKFRIELHGFSDSSLELYCAVVYLRFINDCGIKVSFLASKTKVAPLKKLTIPRLELLGCLLLSKLIKEVLEGVDGRINVDDIYCWSDSKVALCWIKGKEKSWKAWVENRVVSIRNIVGRDRWRFVKGEINPADVPTRISSHLNESFDGCWFSGPSFLLSQHFESSGEDISTDGTNGNTVDEVNAEAVRAVGPTSCFSNTTQEKTCDDVCSLNAVIDCTRFSTLRKLVGVTGYVMRFILNIRKRLQKRTDIITDDILTVEEYESALSRWIEEEQLMIKKQSNYGNVRASLNLFDDKDGLLRLKGRFANSKLRYEQQYPVLLRSDSHFTKLIIWDAHEATMHHGVESTLAWIRSRYWIIKGRKTVKNVLRKCVVCKRYQGKPLRSPASPDLPEFRVDHSGCAFQVTGLDFAGPLYVKSNLNNNKVYILLLTCASSRAIHLELTMDMSIEGFLRGFKRFIARRGIPDIVINDNFKTFRSRDVKRYMLRQGIKQQFILPASPWWGGFYERLVRTVKSCLKKTLGRAHTTFEELQTILCEVEIAINNRPLAYLSEDDLDEPLTPFHLIHGHGYAKGRLTGKTVNVAPECDIERCKDRFLHLQKVLRDCWVRFSKEYLNELRQMNMYRKQSTSGSRDLVVGDVVLIKEDEPAPRTQWRIGKVIQLVTGRDSLVRGAKLKVLAKGGKQTIIHRPVQKLIAFEIAEKVAERERSDELEAINENETVGRCDSVETEPDNNRRPTRKAAIDGQNTRRLRDLYYS